MLILLILILILIVLLISFIPYTSYEKYEEVRTANDWGGIPKTCTVKDLEACENKVKSLNDQIEKNNNLTNNQKAESSKSCDMKMNDMKTGYEQRIKESEEKMNTAIKEAQAAEKKASEYEGANMKCEGRLTAVEPSLQMMRESLEKERTRGDQCFKDKMRLEGECDVIRTEYNKIKDKVGSSESELKTLQDALKNARTQITQLSTQYEQLKQQCINQLAS